MLPQVDSQQDYELISLKEEDGKTIMKIKRKFDTCDSEDNKIEVCWLSLIIFFLHFSSSRPTSGQYLEVLMMLSCMNLSLMYIVCVHTTVDMSRKEIPRHTLESFA